MSLQFIPTGCSPIIVDRIREAHTPEQVISELCLEHNFSDPAVRASSHEIFLQYFQAANNDSQWLSQNQELGQKLLEKAFDIIHNPNNQDLKGRYINVVRDSLPSFRNAIPALATNNVEISSHAKKILANSFILSSQSPVYRSLFSGNGTHNYKTNSPHENPKVIKAVVQAAQNLQLAPGKNYSVDDYKQILSYAESMDVGASVFPLFEEKMINDLTEGNAYNMAVLATKHGLKELSEKALEKLKPAIHKDNWLEFVQNGTKDQQQEVVNAALNFALDQLPGWIADKEQNNINVLVENLQHLTVMRSGVMHRLNPANFKLILSKLPANLLEINLEKCDFKLVPDLKKFPSLYLVNLMDCENLINISNLRMNKQIKFAFFDGCKNLKNLMPLQNAPHLTQISVTNCKTMDDDSLEFLLKHPNLEKVGVTGWESNPKLDPVMGRILSQQQIIKIELNKQR